MAWGVPCGDGVVAVDAFAGWTATFAGQVAHNDDANDTGVAGTSALLAYIDNITGFPLATNGGDITIQWDNGAYRIFSL